MKDLGAGGDHDPRGLASKLPEVEFKLATRMYRKGKYAEALEHYTRCLFRFKDNQAIYSGLGLCLLATNDFNKAHYYFERMLDKEAHSPVALVAMAYLDLIEGREGAALQKYTQLIKLNYHVARIKKILNALRQSGNARDFAIAQPAAFFWVGSVFPTQRRLFTLKNLGFLCGLIVLVFGLGLLVQKWVLPYLPHPTQVKTIGAEQLYPPLPKSASEIPQLKKNYEERLKSIYLYDLPQKDTTFSSATLLKLFEETKKAIVKGEINVAQVNVNRVLQSEANLLLKEKFRLLESAIPEATLSQFNNTFRMKELIQHPYYEKCWVKYRGLVGNKKDQGKLSIFDFTFEDEGDTWTAQVELEKIPGFEIESGRQVVLLARYLGFDQNFKKPILRAVLVKRFVN